MAIPPFVQFPDDLCVSSIILTLDHVISRTESPYTLQSQSFKWDGERWRITAAMPKTTSAEVARRFFTFQLKLKASYGRFTYSPSVLAKRRGVGGGTPVVYNATTQGASTLVVSGFPVDTENVLMEGDFIQLGTGVNSRLHCVLENADSDSNGRSTLTIAPPLRSSYAVNSPVEINKPYGVFRMTSNAPSISVEVGQVYRAQFEAIEAL